MKSYLVTGFKDNKPISIRLTGCSKEQVMQTSIEQGIKVISIQAL